MIFLFHHPLFLGHVSRVADSEVAVYIARVILFDYLVEILIYVVVVFDSYISASQTVDVVYCIRLVRKVVQLSLIHIYMLALFSDLKPKFVKHFADAGSVMKAGFRAYIEEVQAGTFPDVYKRQGRQDD